MRPTLYNVPGAVLQCLVACLLLLIADTSLVTEAAAPVEYVDGLPIIHLSGTPYELGYQHGQQLRTAVRQSVSRLLGYFRSYLKIPFLDVWAANWWLDRAWIEAQALLPPDIREEFRGLSEGSGVPLRELYRLHAIPDRTYSCSSFAAWGPRTASGQLIHTRNLDWNIHAGIQDSAAVFVVHPKGKHAFLNIGWAGFIGVLSGVNEQQLSIGQIGAETTDVTYRGVPMVFLMRRVLEEADGLSEAARLIEETPRTVGVNYVIADAKAHEAIVIETTQHFARVFRADDLKEHDVAYARPLAHAVFRADAAMDPQIRDRQLASHGDPRRPGLEDPSGSSAYDVRYLGQAAGLETFRGRLDVQRALEILKAVAPSSNVQSVVFAWPEVYVANAQGNRPAAQTTYHRLNAAKLLFGDSQFAR